MFFYLVHHLPGWELTGLNHSVTIKSQNLSKQRPIRQKRLKMAKMSLNSHSLLFCPLGGSRNII